MSSIFISYRRADSGGHAGRLFDRLRHWFDDGEVFFDLDGIDAGDEFPARLEAAVSGARVVLVLIGPDWLKTLAERAKGTAVDYVRREVALALRLRAECGSPRLIPVMLGGAAVPDLGALPAELRDELATLGKLDMHEFSGKQADWDNQFVRLRDLLTAQEGVPKPRFRAPAGTQRPFRTIDHSLSPHFQDPHGLLARLRASLEGGATAVVARAALYGMGGVGKTQLALKYSHDYRDAYAGVWWFRAETEQTLQLDAHDVCTEVAAHVDERESPTRALNRWLAAQPGAWLLVFDNAEDPAALRPHLPQGGPHHVIITSRNPAWGGLAQPLELDTWSDAQAAAFLAKRLPGTLPADRHALAADLGGLPLALEQAASFVESTGTAIADYRALLAGVDTAGLALDEGRPATGYEHSVAATLSVAFAKLSPAASRLLRICAFAAPEALPERFLREAGDALPAEVAAAAANSIAWNKTLGELRGFGLAERIQIPTLDGTGAAATEPALTMHRLTQQVVRCRLARADLDGAVLAVVLRRACPLEAEHPTSWPRFAALEPHIQRLDAFSDASWFNRRSYVWLLDRLGTYLLYGPTLFSASAQCLCRALAIGQADLGDEHPDTLTSMGNLAGTLWAQGDLPGARALQERVLEVSRRVLGDEHPNTLTAMNNLAGTLRAQGDLPGARALQERVLEVRRLVPGDEHPDTLRSMNNLAGMLRAQGDVPGARALQERALEVSRRVLGDEHPDTLASMNNLAQTLSSQRDLPGARALQEQALKVCRRVLGDEHPDTLGSMSNLALTLSAQGDLPGARALQERVLEVCRRVLGKEHPNTLASMGNLAHTLWAQDDLPGARALQERVLEVCRRVLGYEHPDTLTSMNNLAVTQWRTGAGAAAFESMLAAARGRLKVLGPDHPETQGSAEAVAAMRKALGLSSDD